MLTPNVFYIIDLISCWWIW